MGEQAKVTRGRMQTAGGEIVYADVADALLAALIEIESSDAMQRSRHIRDIARAAIAAATKEQK